ncbi:4-hydroxybenzoate polyprenyltransferase, mitochondrial [Mycena venus]|uniref:4-hydroxybenzoate polyprenyltransferase, mitochondrial n=1 Tax=Mycena venus TaxID=2733690 RepID=A0A8H7DFD1_9AGAR|nr:4-hydroxybenzoate polyprenyltransferase, mitochondrial [Mycena venus]
MALLMKLVAVPNRTEIHACWELCRLDNNIGFWVVWLPLAWSISMAYHSLPEISGRDAILCGTIYMPFCFGIKSLIMTIDDILDHDIDKLVARTKNRALPRGAISLERAWLLFGEKALYISMTVWPLYIIYPTCKRWTSLAPILLGIMFNVGVFMGWTELMTYETVYQHQDRQDDDQCFSLS